MPPPPNFPIPPLTNEEVRCIYSSLCSQCGRPKAENIKILTNTLPFFVKRALCIRLDKGQTSANKVFAQQSRWNPYGLPLEFVLPVTPRFSFDCTPEQPPPPDLRFWVKELDAKLPPLVDVTNTRNPSCWRIMDLNCGGGSSLPEVCDLMSLLDPDLIFLQELWETDPQDEIAFRRYVIFLSAFRDRGQGLCIDQCAS
eukprot:EG_transcript_30425